MWISVKERLPENYDRVLVAVGWGDKNPQRVYLVKFIEKDGNFEHEYPSIGGAIHKVTHWMPLPAPHAVIEDCARQNRCIFCGNAVAPICGTCRENPIAAAIRGRR